MFVWTVKGVLDILVIAITVIAIFTLIIRDLIRNKKEQKKHENGKD